MRVKLALYDITGRLVKKFVDGEVEPGVKTVVWNGIADDNKVCASGVYLLSWDWTRFTRAQIRSGKIGFGVLGKDSLFLGHPRT